MSSGLTSRPSLSGQRLARYDDREPGVVGINLPTFVERRRAKSSGRASPRVVGINLPTFVERLRRSAPPRSRPSVVGINLPTFVERSYVVRCKQAIEKVSSGLTSRPSLSGGRHMEGGAPERVSSGLTSRPSLSEEASAGRHENSRGVVGINLPTFVER